MVAALLGRALCGGQVLKALKPLSADLEPRLRPLSDPAATDRKVMAFRAALHARHIVSCAALQEAWSSEPRFLMRELAALLDESRRAELVGLWPKLLVMAERWKPRPRASA